MDTCFGIYYVSIVAVVSSTCMKPHNNTRVIEMISSAQNTPNCKNSGLSGLLKRYLNPVSPLVFKSA